MKELYKEIIEKIATLSVDITNNVENGNKAAGARARKATLELEKLFKQYRKESVEAVKK